MRMQLLDVREPLGLVAKLDLYQRKCVRVGGPICACTGDSSDEHAAEDLASTIVGTVFGFRRAEQPKASRVATRRAGEGAHPKQTCHRRRAQS